MESIMVSKNQDYIWRIIRGALCSLKPVFAFLESYDFFGKIIVPFCTHEDIGIGHIKQEIIKASPKKGNRYPWNQCKFREFKGVELDR